MFRASRNKERRYSIGLAHIEGVQKNTQKPISFGYSQILAQELLLSTRIQIDGKLWPRGAFGATFLNGSESVQYAGWLEQSPEANNSYKLSLQSTVFEAWRDIDGSMKISHSNDGGYIATSIYKNIGSLKSSFGLEWSEQSNDLGVLVEFTSHQKTKIGTLFKFFGSSSSNLISPVWLDDLNPARRSKNKKNWSKIFSLTDK